MKRRNFLGGLIALPVAVVATKAGPEMTLGGKFGRITVGENSFPRQFRVWLDGREVSNDCFEADDIEGYVKLYKRNAKGEHYIQHAPDCPEPGGRSRRWVKNNRVLRELHEHCDQLAQERLTGHVVIVKTDLSIGGRLPDDRPYFVGEKGSECHIAIHTRWADSFRRSQAQMRRQLAQLSKHHG